MQIIEYGNPDNDSEAGDLKGHNQVYIRCELFLGWGIIDATAFSRIIAEPTPAALTLTLSEATTLVGGTKVAIAETAVALHEYLIKINGTVPRKGDIVTDGEDGWADYSEGDEIAVHAGDKLVVVEALAETGAVAKAGTAVVKTADIKAGS